MSIVTAYVREQKRYTKNDLKKLFEFNDQSVQAFIKTLKAYGVLKSVRYAKDQFELSDLLDEDIQVIDESAGNNECLHIFTYVGVITLGNRVLKIYPKYILSEENPLEEIKQVVKVLKKYSNSEKQVINLFNSGGENKSFNTLAVILYLLNDYHENGIYTNSEEILEINGEGDINWSRTIDEGFALIDDNIPYYFELQTRKILDDDFDYFKRLHECVITECSKQLKESELEDIFQIVTADISDEKLSSFGSREYILSRIISELNVQYNTRKQLLLKTIFAFISQEKKLLDVDAGLSMYGTTAYNMVWEKACAEVFDNRLNIKLNNLKMPKPVQVDYKIDNLLIEVIEHPVWKRNDVEINAIETLKPDIVSIYEKENASYFIIFDAKYYNLVLEKGHLSGNPGVGDVNKQFLYQLAYKNFIKVHGFAGVKNCFLMPTEENEIIDMGSVNMKMLSELGLEEIIIRKIPAKKLFDYYLKQKKMDISELYLF